MVERRTEIDTAINALVAGVHVFYLGTPGCLAGDTEIVVNRAGVSRKMKIENIVKRMAGETVRGRSYNWDPRIPTYVQRADGMHVRLALMANAWESGVKETFTLTTTSGRSIRATTDHPFLTMEGEWAKLGELQIGDIVRVNAGLTQKGGRVKPHYRDRSTAYHPNQRPSSTGFRTLEHRLVMESYLNRLSFDEYLYILRNDPDRAASLFFLPSDISVHHTDHDVSNNDLHNLAFMTQMAHGREHGPDAAASVLADVGGEAITSIKKHGEEMTYDIEVADNPHNFIANGFVVHNTAKSMMVDRLNAYIKDARTFKILMSRFTTPDEVFGPVSLAGLKEDRFERRIEGYLADAELVFLDEGFKSNSSVLNALLWAINERIYRHGVNVVHIPLSTLFLASNELPQDESLGALYDRLLFRHEVKKVRDQQSFVRMIQTTRPEVPVPILTWDEIETAKAEAKRVVIPNSVVTAVADLRKKLAEKGIEPTDRRFIESLKIVRAAAWLDGCTQADTEHLRPLQHTFWEIPEQAATVSQVVLAIANPLENEAVALLHDLDKLEEGLNKIAGDDDKQRKGAELHGKLRKAKKDLDALKKRAGSGRRRTSTLNEIQDRLTVLTERVLEEVFRIDPSEGVALT